MHLEHFELHLNVEINVKFILLKVGSIYNCQKGLKGIECI